MNTSTTPKVQYGYANGSANTVRPSTLTYPNGRVLTYSYGSADSMADVLSRVAGIVDDDVGSTHLADYSYLGLGTFVEVDYTEPEIEYTLIGTAGGDDPDTGDIYRGFDRFSRVKDSYWRNYGNSTDIDRIKYGYDRNGNRTYRENTVATANNAYFDEVYLYDAIDRLKYMERGRLNAQKGGVTNKTFAQCWTLDATGNWRKFLEDSDGDGNWSLNQTRTPNRVNEISNVTESVGPSWITPAYSRAGNMTTVPKPADSTAAFTGTYDAWNRLIKLEDGSGTVAQYEYDGVNRRTVEKTYTSGALSETRNLYFTEPSNWQAVEERIGSDTHPKRQSVWGLRYFDDLILRDRDNDHDGTVDERLYGMQDANWNCTSIIDNLGTAIERFTYAPFGTFSVLTASFENRDASLYNWSILFTGYKCDLESLLYYVRYRSHHSGFGWLERDPSLFDDSPNLYSYAHLSPLTFTDSQGLSATVSCPSCVRLQFASSGPLTAAFLQLAQVPKLPPRPNVPPTLVPPLQPPYSCELKDFYTRNNTDDCSQCNLRRCIRQISQGPMKIKRVICVWCEGKCPSLKQLDCFPWHYECFPQVVRGPLGRDRVVCRCTLRSDFPPNNIT